MTQATQTITIAPARNIIGTVRLPGDKSISHRYAMLAALARGDSRFSNFSSGADCASTLGCIAALGCRVERDGNTGVVIGGRGLLLQPPDSTLDCGNSGSTMRMLAGILAGQPFTTEMVGDESLSRRPMQRIIEPLTAMGAQVQSNSSRPPLRISGGALKAIDYKLPVASAQVKSAVLLAGLFAEGETWVEEPLVTRDHTELALSAFGINLKREHRRAGVQGGHALHAIEAVVPGDISSAAFFLCAAALFPESELVVDALLLNPTRAVLLDTLGGMGLKTSVLNLEEHHGELVGTIGVQAPRKLKGGVLRAAQSAALIDELPVLAAIAPYMEEGIEIHDARELRVKESDRIAAVASNLRAMGAAVEEFDDGLRVSGEQMLHGAELSSFGDHRIAMAFSIAALRAQGETSISGAEAVSISFPQFFEILNNLAKE